MSQTLHPACDKAIAQAATQPASDAAATPQANWVLATCILASSLAFIDGSVVNVGLPAIGQSLSASGAGLSWVVNGYTLPLCALLLIGGALGDVVGRRRFLMLGVALFSTASVLCAVAPSLGWRAIFYINLPIAAVALGLAARFVPDDRAAEHPPLDWRGATLVAAGLTALTWGLTVASSASSSSASPQSAASGFPGAAVTALFAGAVLLALFVWAEKKRGDAAMMPLALFSSAPFIGLSLLTLLLYGALGGLLVLVPYVLIQSSGYSATQAGAALLPLPLVIALTSSWMGQLATRTGPRWLLSIGPLIVAVLALYRTAAWLAALAAVGAGASAWLLLKNTASPGK